MRISRNCLVWLALALCAAAVLGAMAWLTRGVQAAERMRVVAERERVAAEQRADLEERTRLALWRMDALGAAILMRENRHPVDAYHCPEAPVLAAAAGAAAGALGPGHEPGVMLHFEITRERGLSSPDLAAAQSHPPGAALAPCAERMQRLRDLLAAPPLAGDPWAQLNRAAQAGEESWLGMPTQATRQAADNQALRQIKSADQVRQDANYQFNSSANEHVQRVKALAGQQVAASQAEPSAGRAGAVIEVGQMRGVWLGDELLVLRQVTLAPAGAGAGDADHGRQTLLQGAWLNAQDLREQLLREIADLLPQARLAAADAGRAALNPLAMVSFPFRLERNESVPPALAPAKVPFGAPLWVGWAAVLLAVLTTSLLLRGVMRLSERRASFVSAVTHELRTPLTTFRLYADMLESGAVKPENRGHYLQVLSREADRLSHLVENVLAFSRIERGSARATPREQTLAGMLEPMRTRFEARLASAGMSLVMDLTVADAARRVHVDAAAVEHVLFNLIDNAAKYAGTGTPPEVTVRLAAAARRIRLCVSDHGPGVPLAERKRIFRAFHKSARDAAESRPGVGLGLALSRRLARSLGGDLQYVPPHADGGACFVLALPLSDP
jgi:signal transduction histidine kinase